MSSVVASFLFFFLITVRPGRIIKRWKQKQLFQRVAHVFDTREATLKLASKLFDEKEYSRIASRLASSVFPTGFLRNRWFNREAVNWPAEAYSMLKGSHPIGLRALLAVAEEVKPGATQSIKEWLTDHSGEISLWNLLFKLLLIWRHRQFVLY